MPPRNVKTKVPRLARGGVEVHTRDRVVIQNPCNFIHKVTYFREDPSPLLPCPVRGAVLIFVARYVEPPEPGVQLCTTT